VERLAAVWNVHYGQKAVFEPELVAEATRVIMAGNRWGNPGPKDVGALLSSAVEAGEGDLFATGRFTQAWLDPFAVTLAFLAYRLPAGSAWRAALPAALARVRGWLADPTVTFQLTGPADLVDSPALAGTPKPNNAEFWNYVLTPAALTDPDDPVLRAFPNSSAVRAISVLRSAGLLATLSTSAVAPGTWLQDPRVSAPSVLGSVVAAHGLTAEAAAYYLQLLALPDPTDRNVAQWNGWTAKQVSSYGATLVDAGLVVSAKRERAGRSLFLPGGWVTLKAAAVPFEAWKGRLLSVEPNGARPLSAVVPLRPVGDLFADAWRRVVEGDGPRWESLG
jgi:hypothetical protein